MKAESVTLLGYWASLQLFNSLKQIGVYNDQS
jgi:hypothetical protein